MRIDDTRMVEAAIIGEKLPVTQITQQEDIAWLSFGLNDLGQTFEIQMALSIEAIMDVIGPILFK